MNDFKLDTSGSVEKLVGVPPVPHGGDKVYGWITWPELEPFTQGYIEAMFNDGIPTRLGDGPKAITVKLTRAWGFSDLSPETLARIMEDCAAFASANPRHAEDALDGQTFWINRQREVRPSRWAHFPPITVYLGDDGKVRFQ